MAPIGVKLAPSYIRHRASSTKGVLESSTPSSSQCQSSSFPSPSPLPFPFPFPSSSQLPSPSQLPSLQLLTAACHLPSCWLLAWLACNSFKGPRPPMAHCGKPPLFALFSDLVFRPHFGAKWHPKGDQKSIKICKNRSPRACHKPPPKKHQNLIDFGMPPDLKQVDFSL